jgi:hypothetical protein
MAKRLPTILLVCLVFAVALLARQVTTLQTSVAELRDAIQSAHRSVPVLRAHDPELPLDYDSALQLWRERGERIVPISDPSIERAMQMDRMRPSVIRDRTGQELRVTPAPTESNAEVLKQFIDQLPEANE